MSLNFYKINKLITEGCNHKKKKKDTVPKKWKGTVAAMKQNHPDKFDPECKDPDKLCPYAIANAMDKKGDEPHYKSQKDTKAKPKKKEKYKNESTYLTFEEWVQLKETGTSTGCVASFARPIGSGKIIRRNKKNIDKILL
jgi:hypothetical protein